MCEGLGVRGYVCEGLEVSGSVREGLGVRGSLFEGLGIQVQRLCRLLPHRQTSRQTRLPGGGQAFTFEVFGVRVSGLGSGLRVEVDG